MITANASEVLRQQLGNDAKCMDSVAEELRKIRMAQLIYDARVGAGLTQAQLAAKVGTRQPVIARLEDADYGQQSLRMLERIAETLGLDVEIRLVKRTSMTKITEMDYIPLGLPGGTVVSTPRPALTVGNWKSANTEFVTTSAPPIPERCPDFESSMAKAI